MAKTTEVTTTKRFALSLRDPSRTVDLLIGVYEQIGDVVTGTKDAPVMPQLKESAIDNDAVPALIKAANSMLAEPATDKQIKVPLAVMAGQIKWPATEIVHNKADFLAGMFDAIKAGIFSAPVIEKAVRLAVSKYSWMPSSAEFVKDCQRVEFEMRSGIFYMQLPEHSKFELSYHIAFVGWDKDKTLRLLLSKRRVVG